MDLLGSNFLDVRNDYVIPLVKYGVARNKYQYWSFKDTITENIISLNKLSGKSVEIELPKSEYSKALYCEIELFLNKTAIGYSDFIKSKSNSPCWSFVTLYYFTFFSVTCLFRFLNKGFVWLNFEQKKRIEDFALAVNSSPISLETGNYYFSRKNDNSSGHIVLTLTAKGEGLHRLTWIQLESTFRDFLPRCDNSEKAIINMFLSIFSAFKNDFPSNLRNKLNYNSESSILDLEQSLSHVSFKDIQINFAKGLFNINTALNLDNQIQSIAHLSFFLYKFIDGLHKEYVTRGEFGKDFLKERESYLRHNHIPLL